MQYFYKFINLGFFFNKSQTFPLSKILIDKHQLLQYMTIPVNYSPLLDKII